MTSIDFNLDWKLKLQNRFITYAKIYSTSDPESESTPSTPQQWDIANYIFEELKTLGLSDVSIDEHGYIYAYVPSNLENDDEPVVGFISHYDTSPDFNGKDVKPQIWDDYDGKDLLLNKETGFTLSPSKFETLKDYIGKTLITTDGTSLLGADDKAGVAEIMDAARILMQNPEIKHGDIKILFTPDEEIGRGVDHADLKKLGADYGYTMDGERAGTLEDETFSADGVRIKIDGISIHPGYAKNKMVNALKIAADLIDSLPKDRLSPETTSGKEGFVHPVHMTGSVEEATIDFIIRDHDTKKLAEHEAELEAIAKEVVAKYAGASFTFTVNEQYRNMKEVLDQHPRVVDIAMMGIERAGMKAEKRSIRGGTDGSRLSFMGLPCPNIFAGGHAFHGKQEWVSVQDMQKAVLTILHIAALWEEVA